MNRDQLLSIIRDKRPSTIGALRGILSGMDVHVDDQALAAMIGDLSEEGLVTLRSEVDSSSFSDYLIDFNQTGWMYLSLVVALLEALLVESRSTDGVLGASRLVLGFALLGFIPGYSMLRLVFPQRNLGILEQVILSLFLSILLSILTGVVLGAQDAFQATSNVLFLTALTFCLSISAAYRSYGILRSTR